MASCLFIDNRPRKGVFVYVSEGKTRRRLKEIVLKFGGRDSESMGGRIYIDLNSVILFILNLSGL
jgi:hypothetical protein